MEADVEEDRARQQKRIAAEKGTDVLARNSTGRCTEDGKGKQKYAPSAMRTRVRHRSDSDVDRYVII
jgi:hypothetical protein